MPIWEIKHERACTNPPPYVAQAWTLKPGTLRANLRNQPGGEVRRPRTWTPHPTVDATCSSKFPTSRRDLPWDIACRSGAAQNNAKSIFGQHRSIRVVHNQQKQSKSYPTDIIFAACVKCVGSHACTSQIHFFENAVSVHLAALSCQCDLSCSKTSM
jgi:hypothetical protein